jgi:hypothetical protein
VVIVAAFAGGIWFSRKHKEAVDSYDFLQLGKSEFPVAEMVSASSSKPELDAQSARKGPAVGYGVGGYPQGPASELPANQRPTELDAGDDGNPW